MTLGRSTSSDLAPAGPAPGETGALTPAGLQPRRRLARRRLTMLAVNLATLGVLAAALADVLGAGGWDAVDFGLFACFLISAPWMILGFWNATVGLWLLRVRRDGLAQVSPFADELTAPLDAPPLDGGRIAVLMTLRNEDPERAFARLLAMRAELDRSGAGARFDMFVLSDT
ncbi:MAG: glucans biosynthesis glucosyltransferase MdoH, partial [Pseudomonadota bacterium]